MDQTVAARENTRHGVLNELDQHWAECCALLEKRGGAKGYDFHMARKRFMRAKTFVVNAPAEEFKEHFTPTYQASC